MKGLELGIKTDILEKRLKAQQPRQFESDTIAAITKQYS